MIDEKFPKTLITGGNGMVGSYIDFGVKTDRKTLDVTDLRSVKAAFEKYKPETVLHLAALTDQSECETNPTAAYNVNAIGAYYVALAAKSFGAKMVYVSTNAVFSGKEKKPYTAKDKPNPATVYGRSKYLGELVVKELSDTNLIVRSSWIFGGGPNIDKKFVSKIMRGLASEVSEIQAVNDSVGTPTFAKDLVKTLKQLIADNAKGIVHVTNSGQASRYDMAKIICETVGSTTRVRGVPLRTFKTDVPAPINEALKSDILIRPWQEALKEYIKTEWNNYQSSH